MGFVYLGALIFSLLGMVVLDWKFKLFFYKNFCLASVVLVVGVLFFLVWDLVGISLGIFFRGDSQFMTGVLLTEELPLEEVFFLALLCYVSMNFFCVFYKYFLGKSQCAYQRELD